MMLQTGGAAAVAGSAVIGADMFGYNYTGFRPVENFLEQLHDNQVGLITWPGGMLSENRPDRYGLNFDGLFNPALDRPGLGEMFVIAHDTGAALAVVLPTARYLGQDAALRADIQNFMGDLLGGVYGPPPPHLTFLIGSEFYMAFPGGPDEPSHYGHVANIYVEELTAALNDPSVNLIGADPEIAVQAGRSLAEDALIRAELTDDALVEVDQIIHHRFAFNATGVDRTADEISQVMDAWSAQSTALGGDAPELFLNGYGVGSYTRVDAMMEYLADDAAAGGSLTEADLDEAGRSHTDFETFWQHELTKRDYGAEHPRLILEMLAEYGAEGATSAVSYGTDVVHPGRLSQTDSQGVSQEFVGQDLMDMMAESVQGTTLLDFSLGNDRTDEVWSYGFENADKLVIFLSADSTPPEGVTVNFAGLGTTYRQVAVDSLTSQVPQDWMARWGVIDNPAVDETPEAQTYAIGVQTAVTPDLGAEGVSLRFSAANEVIRLSFAKTDAGAAEIAGYSEGPLVDLTPLAAAYADPGLDIEMAGFADALPMVAMMDADVAADAEIEAEAEAEAAVAAATDGGGGGGGGILLALLPLLMLLGGGF